MNVKLKKEDIVDSAVIHLKFRIEERAAHSGEDRGLNPFQAIKAPQKLITSQEGSTKKNGADKSYPVGGISIKSRFDGFTCGNAC